MRKVWFVTRPERDPKFHTDALEALYEATDQFSIKWNGNREVHKRYEAVLASKELKRDNISADGSGGRTWAAMMRIYHYVYLNENGYLVLTKVGQKLLDGKNVRENITKQIVNLQIPNDYFLSSGFRPKFDDGFEIRPARFLIKMTNQAKLDYFVTKKEITFFCMTAKKDNQIAEVTEKIISFRNSSPQQQEVIQNQIALEFDHRNRSDSPARHFEAAHSDVANTFMLLCDYTGLVDYIRGDALRVPSEKQKKTNEVVSHFENRYPFNKRYKISFERFTEHADMYTESYKANPYGNISPATNHNKTISKVKRLLANYPALSELSVDEISEILSEQLSINEAQKYAHLLQSEAYTTLNEDFIESYLKEQDNLAFEDKTGQILEAIGFETVIRPKPTSWISGHGSVPEIEILIHIDEKTICLIDAKNYHPKFALSAPLSSLMASTYIPDYQQYEGKEVKHFAYVTADKMGGIKNLKKISKMSKQFDPKADVTGAMISASALLGFLDYCLDKELPK